MMKLLLFKNSYLVIFYWSHFRATLMIMYIIINVPNYVNIVDFDNIVMSS